LRLNTDPGTHGCKYAPSGSGLTKTVSRESSASHVRPAAVA